MKRLAYFSLILIIICFNQCLFESSSPNDNDSDIDGSISYHPMYGTAGTEFSFEVNLSCGNDIVNPDDGFLFKWDFDNDGVYDTDWLDTIEVQHTFISSGNKEIGLTFKDNEGKTGKSTLEMEVLEMVEILSNETGSSNGNIDWCPDGSNRIAFDNCCGGVLWSVEYPAGTVIQLIPDAEDHPYHNFPEWSPDGSRIAFNDGNGLQYIDLTTGQYTIITPYCNLDCCWSPDGNWIIYAGNYDTYIYSVAEDTSYKFLSGVYNLCWSPDGTQLAAYELPGESGITINIIDVESRSGVMGFTVPGVGSKLDWSPDGKWISLGFTDDTELSVLEYETGDIVKLNLNGYQSLWYPTWSSDGTMIAFEGQINGNDDGLDIWAVKVPDAMLAVDGE